VLKVYQAVVERLLLTIAEGEEALRLNESPAIVVNEDSTVWPPWPWPPWGDDDGDDDGDKDKAPVNRTHRAHKLAKKVVKLERKIAKASLDL
jgi:endothelin-converting enzyme